MILDREFVFSDQQAVTVTANSTDVDDLATTADASRGEPLRFRAQVDVTFTGGTSHQVQLVASASPTLSSPTVLLDTGAVAEATLVAGYVMIDAFMPTNALRYIGVIHTVVGTHGAGKISAFLAINTETGRKVRPLGNTSF